MTTYYEFRAARHAHGYDGFVEFDRDDATIADAEARLTELGFEDITYLARATAPERGAPVWATPHGTVTTTTPRKD